MLKELSDAADEFDKDSNNAGKSNPCRIQDDQCLCCDDMGSLPKNAFGFYSSITNTVYLCSDRNPEKETVSKLVHELKHAQQHCPKTNTIKGDGKSECEKRMCMELQAYAAQYKYDASKPSKEIEIKITAGAWGSTWMNGNNDECKGETAQSMMAMAARLFAECVKQ